MAAETELSERLDTDDAGQSPQPTFKPWLDLTRISAIAKAPTPELSNDDEPVLPRRWERTVRYAPKGNLSNDQR
jgi:hypothetical protein